MTIAAKTATARTTNAVADPAVAAAAIDRATNGETGQEAGSFFLGETRMRENKRDITIAWFGALCFFLSAIEYMIPKPLPFLRLGIANLPLMLAIDVLPVPAYFALALIKIAGQGLIGGTIFSYVFLFSIAGSLASATIMLALRKAFRERVSWIGVSVAGAFASNAAQLTLARYWIFGESAWLIMPPFLAVGAVTGTLLGVFANAFAARSAWYASIRSGGVELPETLSPPEGSSRAPGVTAIRFFAGIALILALLLSESLAVQGAIVALSVILVLASHMRISPAPTLVMTASVVFFNLLVPFGKVLASPLGLAITEGALRSGIKKALAVEGMIFISRWMLRGGLRLPGRAGGIIESSFGILARLTAGKGSIDLRNPIASLDRLMSGRD
jgi:uncharacterized membrane protein